MGQKAGSRTPLSKKATALPYYCEDGLFLLWKVFWQMRDDERTPIRAAPPDAWNGLPRYFFAWEAASLAPWTKTTRVRSKARPMARPPRFLSG